MTGDVSVFDRSPDHAMAAAPRSLAELPRSEIAARGVYTVLREVDPSENEEAVVRLHGRAQGGGACA
jgi:hypothetical protein